MSALFLTDKTSALDLSTNRYLLWSTLPEDAPSSCIDINVYIDQNSELLREAYLLRLDRLGSLHVRNHTIVEWLRLPDGFSTWFFSSFYEKNPVQKQLNLVYVIKLLAILHIHETTPITLVRDNFNDLKLYQLSKILLHSKEYRIYLRILLLIKTLLRHCVSLVLVTCRILITIGSRLSRPAYPTKCPGGTISLFDFFASSSDTQDPSSFKSFYWGDLAKVLQLYSKNLNYFSIYFPTRQFPTLLNANKYLKNLNSNSSNCFFIISPSTAPLVLLRAFVAWLSVTVRASYLWSQLIFNPSLELFWLYLIHRAWSNSFCSFTSYLHVMKHYSLDTHLRDIRPQSLSLYLCENQPWESSLIFHWRRYQSSPIIAIPHTTIRFWDLRYCHTNTEHLPIHLLTPKPDYIAINGPLMHQNLSPRTFPFSLQLHVEALRYNKPHPNYRTYAPSTSRSILILTSIDSSSTTSLLEIIRSFSLTNPDYDLHLKSHPLLEVHDVPDSITNLSSNHSLDQLLHSSSIVITDCLTSAVVDALLYPRRVFVYLPDTSLNLCPVQSHPNLSYFRTVSQLSRLLLDKPPLSSALRPQDQTLFYTSYNLIRWTSAISSLSSPY